MAIHGVLYMQRGEIAHVFAGLAEVCHDILHFHVSVPLLYVVCTVVQHGS